MGVYLLVMVGAATSLTGAGAACTTWPLCDGRLFVPTGDAAAIAWGHRVLALFVGVLVLLTAVIGLRVERTRRIRASLILAAALYPVQILLGALTATTVTTASLSALHLLVAMLIFGGLLLALAWTLERRHPSIGDDRRIHETDDGNGGDPSPIDVVDTGARGHGEPVVRTAGTDRRTLALAYLQMTKPRLMWLLCLVAAAGMALAAGPSLSPAIVVATLSAGVLAIGASGTFNHVLERDVDRRMARTSDRPLATDLVPVRNALVFGILLALGSLAIFYVFVNPLAAVLGLTAIVFYSVIYTLVLKPNTVQNTVIGGAAGALPALIGWAAVTETIGLPALVLAAVIFCWTPAHFYNLALAYKEDYARGGFPMLSVVRGERVTRKHIVLYTGATFLVAGALAAVDTLGWLYATTGIVFGAVFLWAVIRLHHEQTERAAFRSFHASNAYLGMLLLAIVVDAIVF